MDTGQSTQTGFQRSDFVTSPVTENRTRAVREYEQTIDQLRKENFDLKLKIFLIEEESRKKYQRGEGGDEADNSIQVIVGLKVEAESLKSQLEEKDKVLQDAIEQIENFTSELSEKEQELHNAFEQAEKYASDFKELEEQNEQLKAAIKEIPSAEDLAQIHEEYTSLRINNVDLTKELEEKNQEIENLITMNKTLEDKVSKRSQALRGCVMRYKEDINMPSQIRKVIKAAIEAAKNNDKETMRTAVDNLQLSLCEIMPEPSDVFGNSFYVRRSFEDSKSKGSSEKINAASSESLCHEMSVSSEAISTNVRKNIRS